MLGEQVILNLGFWSGGVGVSGDGDNRPSGLVGRHISGRRVKYNDRYFSVTLTEINACG
jgi:hypothetical protein